MLSILCLRLLSGLLLLGVAGAAAPDAVTVKDGDRPYEIRIDRESALVSVFTPSGRGDVPRKMSITLYEDSGTGRTVQLRAVPPSEKGVLAYQGRLALEQGSAVSFELRFDLGSGGERALRSPG